MQKRAIVTGANSGIGKETTKALLQQGYELIMVCRNKEKAKAVFDEFESKFHDAKIHLLICDLSSVNEVKQLADSIKRQFKALTFLSIMQVPSSKHAKKR